MWVKGGGPSSDRYLEAKRKFDEEKERVLREIPMHLKSQFRKLSFALRSKHWVPAIQLGPYDVEPGLVRDQWFKMFRNCRSSGRPLSRLVYWYGTPRYEYSFLQEKQVVSYAAGLKNGYGQILEKIKRRAQGKTHLTEMEMQIIKGLEEMRTELPLDPGSRISWASSWEEEFESLKCLDDDTVKCSEMGVITEDDEKSHSHCSGPQMPAGSPNNHNQMTVFSKEEADHRTEETSQSSDVTEVHHEEVCENREGVCSRRETSHIEGKTVPNEKEACPSDKQFVSLEKEAKQYKAAILAALDELICPITKDLPLCPVIAEDGNVYERSAIEEYFRRTDDKMQRSPTTNLVMGSKLIPAVLVRNTIEKLVSHDSIAGDKVKRWRLSTEDAKLVDGLKKEADGGDATAMYHLGCHYFSGGLGLKVNMVEAFRWFEKASEKGNVSGMAFFGRCLQEGLGTPQNLGLGMHLVTNAANRGSSHGAYLLALAYYQGLHGFPVNHNEAKNLLTRVVQKQCGVDDLMDVESKKAGQYLEKLQGHVGL